MVLAFGDNVVSFCLAFLLYVLVEAPFRSVAKMLLKPTAKEESKVC